jgi:hypothetical protein
MLHNDCALKGESTVTVSAKRELDHCKLYLSRSITVLAIADTSKSFVSLRLLLLVSLPLLLLVSSATVLLL